MLSSINIVLQLSELRLSTPPPPTPGRESYSLISLCGLYWGVLLDRVRLFVCVPKRGILFYARLFQPSMVSTIDIPFQFSILTRGQGVKPAASPLHPNIGQKPPSPFSPPEGTGVATFEVLISAEPRLRDAECYEVSVAKNGTQKCQNKKQ